MNYPKAIEKYCNKKIDWINDEVLLTQKLDGKIEITKWNVAGKVKPTIKQLETIYNNNKTEIDNEIEKERIINDNYNRIVNKLVENELINEGLL